MEAKQILRKAPCGSAATLKICPHPLHLQGPCKSVALEPVRWASVECWEFGVFFERASVALGAEGIYQHRSYVLLCFGYTTRRCLADLGSHQSLRLVPSSGAPFCTLTGECKDCYCMSEQATRGRSARPCNPFAKMLYLAFVPSIYKSICCSGGADGDMSVQTR